MAFNQNDSVSCGSPFSKVGCGKVGWYGLFALFEIMFGSSDIKYLTPETTGLAVRFFL